MAKTFLASLQQFAPILALLLQALVLSRFLASRNRNYPLAIVYSIILFLATALSILAANRDPWVLSILPVLANFELVYSACDVMMHIILLGLMLQLIDQTHARLGMARERLGLLAGVSLLVTIAAVWYYSGPSLAVQFTKVRQVISFWMVLLNLYWWTLLVRQKNLDRRILLLSAGIGLQMTGQVISDGLLGMVTRRDDYALLITGLLIIFFTHFACLLSWYAAFDPKNAKQEEPSLRMAH